VTGGTGGSCVLPPVRDRQGGSDGSRTRREQSNNAPVASI